MTPDELAKLFALSQAAQDADAAKLLSIKAEEARIRAQLAALDEQHKQTTGLPMLETLPQRSLGGDMKWQVWVGRRRRDLQIQLARCLAHQGAARRALQKSFGKRAALDQIRSDIGAKQNQTNNVKRDETVVSLGVLKHSRP